MLVMSVWLSGMYQLQTNANPNYGTLTLLWAPKGLIHLYVHNSISETLQKAFAKKRGITCAVAMTP